MVGLGARNAQPVHQEDVHARSQSPGCKYCDCIALERLPVRREINCLYQLLVSPQLPGSERLPREWLRARSGARHRGSSTLVLPRHSLDPHSLTRKTTAVPPSALLTNPACLNSGHSHAVPLAALLHDTLSSRAKSSSRPSANAEARAPLRGLTRVLC